MTLYFETKKMNQNGSLFLSGEQSGLTGIAPPRPPQNAGKCSMALKQYKMMNKRTYHMCFKLRLLGAFSHNNERGSEMCFEV